MPTMPALLTEDGSLDVHISREKRQADASMMGFIKQHMSEILRPLAEHVDQLHGRADLLSEDLEETKQVTQDALEKNNTQDKLIQGLRDDLMVSQRSAAATKTALQQTAAECTSLRSDYDETKLDVAGMNKRLMDTISHADCLQHRQDSTDNTLAKITSKLQNEGAPQKQR